MGKPSFGMTDDCLTSLQVMWEEYALHYATAGYPAKAQRFRRLATQMRDIIANETPSLCLPKTINVRDPEPPKRAPKVPPTPRKPI